MSTKTVSELLREIETLTVYIEQLENYYQASRHLSPNRVVNTADSIRECSRAAEKLNMVLGGFAQQLAPHSKLARETIERWKKEGFI